MEGTQHGNKRCVPFGVATRKQRKLQIQQEARAIHSQAERDDINLARRQARSSLSQAERDDINLARRQARSSLSQAELEDFNLARRQARPNLSQAEREVINLAQRQSQQQQALLLQPEFELRPTNTYIRRPDALLTTQERDNNAVISQQRREADEALRRLSPRSQEEIEEAGRIQRAHNQRRRNVVPTECSAKLNTIDDFNEIDVPEYRCGNMTEICGDCQARFWPKERNTQKKYTTC